MNEKILELAEQAEAHYRANVLGASMYKTPPNRLMEKFAELIIRECAEIAKHHVMNISTYADADFVEKQITENFGVER